MTSSDTSTSDILYGVLSRYNWVSTFILRPRVNELLNTNVSPTPIEANDLKDLIKDLDYIIAKTQNKINLLKNADTSLATKIAHLEDIRCKMHVALSAVRHLPLDVLLEILQWTGDDVRGFNVFSIGDGPWYLGQVCMSWRHAVRVLCPEIWSRMYIECPFKHSEGEDDVIMAPKKNMVALLSEALKHSKNRPLDFYFKCWTFETDEDFDLEEEPEELIQCFDLLLTHSDRWRSIELHVVSSFLPRLSVIRGNLDKLEEFFITCLPHATPGDVDVVKYAPKLRRLELGGMHAQAHIPFPTRNLVSFSDWRHHPGYDTAPHYLNIIASSPHLSEFSHYNYSSAVPESAPSHPLVAHESLHILSTSLGALIDSLVLPGLRVLTAQAWNIIGTPVRCPEDTLSHMHNLIVRSQCSLTSLSFLDATMDDNLLPLLRLSPQLTTLSFAWSYISDESTDDVMTSLFLEMSKIVSVEGAINHALLPRLEVLSFEFSSVDYDVVDYLDTDFVDMVSSRRSSLSSSMLKTLEIEVLRRPCYFAFMDNSGLEVLKGLQEEGLDLRLGIEDGREVFELLGVCDCSNSKDY